MSQLIALPTVTAISLKGVKISVRPFVIAKANPLDQVLWKEGIGVIPDSVIRQHKRSHVARLLKENDFWQISGMMPAWLTVCVRNFLSILGVCMAIASICIFALKSSGLMGFDGYWYFSSSVWHLLVCLIGAILGVAIFAFSEMFIKDRLVEVKWRYFGAESFQLPKVGTVMIRRIRSNIANAEFHVETVYIDHWENDPVLWVYYENCRRAILVWS